MRESTLILGKGRLGRHLYYYLKQMRCSVRIWSRSDGNANLGFWTEESSRVIFAISDSAIADVWKSLRPTLTDKVCFHCSGALYFEDLPGLHPLMTFGVKHYSLALYQSMGFTSDHPGMERALDDLPNPVYPIHPSKKMLYHAHSALLVGLTAKLWQETAQRFRSHLDVNPEILKPYCQQIMKNLVENLEGESLMTGPLKRGDKHLVSQHQSVLQESPYGSLYDVLAEWTQEETK